MNEGDNRTIHVYIAQTSCTYLSSVLMTQAHLIFYLETLRTSNQLQLSDKHIEKLSSVLVVPVSGTAPSTCYIQAIRNYLTGYFLDVHIYHERVPVTVTGIYLPRALAHLINIPHILSGDIQCLNVPR